ncbi:9267_t:CDS:2, partial [Rhizophagus irregularis]
KGDVTQVKAGISKTNSMFGNQFEISVRYTAKEFGQHYAESFNLFDLNVFYKKDNEISLESSPQLHKVETILNEYDESLEKATENNFVDLDSILFVPSYQGNYKFQKHCLTCYQLTKHVLNNEGSSEHQYRSCILNDENKLKILGLTVKEASKETLLEYYVLPLLSQFHPSPS